MTQKQFYMDTRASEYARTLRVMQNYPADKPLVTPHEKSQTAIRLFWTFVLEEKINKELITNTLKSTKIFVQEQMPETISEAIKRYKEVFDVSQKALESIPEELWEEEVYFYTGPMARSKALWFMLFDSIHHRGQMSVYIRLAGGKVPAIYGPSADEPMEPAK